MDELPAEFGKYFLTEKIATGGMAEIYLSKLLGPSGFEKQLVIKQIHPELGGKRAFVDMLVDEAKTLVSLTHGNIVPVYELGVVGGVYFIAMEYIDGPTLHELTRALVDHDAPMEPIWAVYIAAEILKGLDYAHRKGVIHRDLSPRNVMLSREGEIKLVDFGIALRADEDVRGERLAGSYPYMSPEQARGQVLGAASDLFSTGVLLWEMLAGEPLFARPSAEDTLRAVAEAPVPPPSARMASDLEAAALLDTICLRALERDPTARYASAADFLAALNRYLYARDVPVTPAALSALVARWCPPVTRRAAGAGDEPQAGDHSGGSAAARPGDRDCQTRPLPGREAHRRTAERAGDATQPLPPQGTGAAALPVPQGRRRRPPAMRTFATHVVLEEVLAQTDARALPPSPADATAANAPGEQPRLGRQRARGLRVAIAALPLLVLIAAAMLGGRDRHDTGASSRTDAPLLTPGHAAATTADLRDAGSAPSSAPMEASSPWPDAGAAADASRADAVDIRPEPPAHRDADRSESQAGGAPARRFPTPEQAAEVPPGRLKVGANPWAEVYLDGRMLGRAPNAWAVPPGSYTVEVVFPVAGSEARQSFTVSVEPGAETSLGVIDFTTASAAP